MTKREVVTQGGGPDHKVVVLTRRVVFAKRPKDPEDEEVLRNRTRHDEAGTSDLNREVHKEVERSDQPNLHLDRAIQKGSNGP